MRSGFSGFTAGLNMRPGVCCACTLVTTNATAPRHPATALEMWVVAMVEFPYGGGGKVAQEVVKVAISASEPIFAGPLVAKVHDVVEHLRGLVVLSHFPIAQTEVESSGEPLRIQAPAQLLRALYLLD